MANYELVRIADDNSIHGRGQTAFDARYSQKDSTLFNVKNHGVKGDGTTDDTAAIQALIDAGSLAGGRTLFFPEGVYRITNLSLKSSVILLGAQFAYGYGPQALGSTRLSALPGTTGWMIDFVGGIAGVIGMDLYGNASADGTTGADGGIRISTGSWSRASEIHFNNFRGPALQINGGNAHVIDNILAINCCLDRTVLVDTGVMDIGSNDHYISRVEASCSLTTAVTSADLRINSWLIRSTNAFISNCVGEFGDRGFLITGAKNRFTGVRADRNMGIGYENRGGGNVFAGCMAVDNSKSVTNTYPAFKTSGFGNVYSGCHVSYLSAEMPTFAYEDVVNNSDPSARNTYSGCTGKGFQGTFSGINYLGSAFDLPNHAIRSTETPTIAVDRSNFIVLVHTTPTTITDFTGGHSGQTITVLALTGNATVAHNTAIRWQDGKAHTLRANTSYTFTRYNGQWFPASSEVESILVSPNGTAYRLSVSDDGSLTTTTI